MMLFYLCGWSGVIIFAYLVKTKYDWTAPPYRLCMAFAASAFLAAPCALLCNNFLSRETELWVLSDNRWYSFLGFAIGAGFGEEFWKMAAGLLVLITVSPWRSPLRDADCILGFVTIGISFATIENLVTYSTLQPEMMLLRGVTAVPVHASLGFVHGLAVNRARRSNRAWPLMVGYGIAVCIHTLWDTWNILWSLIVPSATDGRWSVPLFPMYLMSAMLVVFIVYAWRRVPELPDEY